MGSTPEKRLQAASAGEQFERSRRRRKKKKKRRRRRRRRIRTRCSPRTRMLTRMLMERTSKHMDMQSRRTLVCNRLFEQYCTYFPCYQSAARGKCRVWSVEWKV